MRWEGLFDELAAQWEAEAREEARGEVADRTRRERATVRLADRIGAHLGRPDVLELLVLGGGRLTGSVLDLGADFLVLGDGGARRIVRLGALVAVTGLGRRVAAGSDVTAARRYGLGYALRGVARNRAPVLVDDVLGRQVPGTIEVVGADHLELLEHPLDVPPRREAGSGRRVIAFDALVAVSST
ncbi:MAG: hypothetical protein IPK37_14595 [Austwickia sp.]|jgi:hypothetical protein|nr:MAG: hypothetical protein IPK37_14595 [Austwickia sp.]